MYAEIIQKVVVPTTVLLVGLLLLSSERTALVGRLCCLFGAQVGLGIYMKEVLSDVELSDERRGIHASFAITGIQQLTSFSLMMSWIGVSSCTDCPYVPKRLSSRVEWLAVLLFSATFILDIALNNFSLTLITISLNLIIRSCFPLPTFLAQQVLAWCTGDLNRRDASPMEQILMLLGCFCAVMAVVARSHSNVITDQESRTLVLGILLCVVSLLAGAVSLALAGVLGSSARLNEFDTVVYMAIPSTLMLLPPLFLIRHPVLGWHDVDNLTDWEITREILTSSTAWPEAVGFAVLSGVFALGYNILKYGIVQKLSATHLAFAGNFNKLATILLALFLGMEPLPQDRWGVVFLLACFGNVGAFTAYSLVKQKRTEQQAQSTQDQEEEEESSDCEDSSLGYQAESSDEAELDTLKPH